ncbi:12064_t:CDS:1, partial [Funneliformis geosporum]
ESVKSLMGLSASARSSENARKMKKGCIDCIRFIQQNQEKFYFITFYAQS